MERCLSTLLSTRAARAAAMAPPTATSLFFRSHSSLLAHTARPNPLRCHAQSIPRRLASVSASSSSSTPPAQAASPSPQSGTSTPQVLTWNQYLALRRTRRRTGLVFSVITAFLSTGTGFAVMSSQDLDAAAAAAIGLDPIIVLGLGTIGFGGLGWLVGPFLGNALFGLWHRGLRNEFAKKDQAFFRRISQRRVDPSSSSLQNPVPDYYGEKIGSVADYRRWLKDQRAFHLKRSGGAGNIAEAGRMVRSGKVAGA